MPGARFSDTFRFGRGGGSVCPPMVSAANLPEADEEGMDSLVSGHMGPPLRQLGKMGEYFLTYFLFECPLQMEKWYEFYRNAKDSAPALCGYHIVGTDLCVRPWWAFRIPRKWAGNAQCFCWTDRWARAYSVGRVGCNAKKDGIPYVLQNAILPNGRFRWGFRDIVSICGHYRMDRAYSVGVMPNFSLNCREK